MKRRNQAFHGHVLNFKKTILPTLGAFLIFLLIMPLLPKLPSHLISSEALANGFSETILAFNRGQKTLIQFSAYDILESSILCIKSDLGVSLRSARAEKKQKISKK